VVDGQLEGNANVADGGIRKGTRSDEIRPIIRPWPLPTGVASETQSWSNGWHRRRANHAKAIPLNI